MEDKASSWCYLLACIFSGFLPFKMYNSLNHNIYYRLICMLCKAVVKNMFFKKNKCAFWTEKLWKFRYRKNSIGYQKCFRTTTTKMDNLKVRNYFFFSFLKTIKKSLLPFLFLVSAKMISLDLISAPEAENQTSTQSCILALYSTRDCVLSKSTCQRRKETLSL